MHALPELNDIISRQPISTQRYLKIGQVAQITGASCKAIRLYEARRLIPAPVRQGTYRIYSERDVFLVHIVKHAQQFGFTLKELEQLTATLVSDNQFPLALANQLMAHKQAELQQQMTALQQRQQQLQLMQQQMNLLFTA